jgi:uncharacterized membrane protein (GlpM family)
MSSPFELSLLAKALWSAAIVIALTWLAERVSTRAAGIVAGAPQNAVLVYFFVGRDMGIPFAVESVPHGVASFTATIAFVLAYYAAASRAARRTALWGTAAGLAAFWLVAIALSVIPFTFAPAALVTACAIAFAIRLFRHAGSAPIARPVRYSARLLFLRGSAAAITIAFAVTTAEFLGPRWAGLMAGFPATLLPTLLIIHLTYGRASALAVLRTFPLGVVSVAIFVTGVAIFFPALGVPLGTAAALAVSVVYLIAVGFAGARRG